jgi:hypothetical protein
MVRIDFRGRDSDRGKPPRVAGRLGLSVFFFFFFAMGSLFEVLIIREFGRAMGQRSWKKVPCTIASSQVQERNDNEEPYAFAVSYRYEYRGQSYTGSAYKRGYSGSDKYTGAQQLMQKYPAGQNNSCYVNPASPGQAVLKRDSLAVGLVILCPLIFVAIGAGGIYFTWKKQPPEAAKPIAAPAIREKQLKGKSKYGLAALFLLFAAVGGGMLYPLGIRPIARTIDARSWATTPCKILRAEVRSHDSDDGTTYSVYILYQYEFDGQTYKSDRYEFIGGSSSGYRGKARVVAEYEAAPNPVCYVNPDHPSEAVLKRGFHAKLLLALFPLPFLLVGVGGLVHIARGKSARGAPAAQSWIARQPGRVVLDDVAALRAADTGRVHLTLKHSARMKFIGMVLVAVFWNGIVSVFVVGTLRDPHVFRVLFMLPFVAVGLGLVAGAVYQFLAMFNPRPALELSSGRVPLGGAAELRWSFDGQTSRIGEFSVTLRGVEEAKYRRGTNTYTDRSTFYEMELYRTSEAQEITSGQVGFIVPQDTMHSFEAENNKIIWNLDIHGDIRGWPDVKESFAINVVPGTA